MRNPRILAVVLGILLIAIVDSMAVGLLEEGLCSARLLHKTENPGRVCLQPPEGGGEPTYVDELNGVYPPVVDGDTDDWDLNRDWFADMYRDGDACKKVEAKLYLLYDCGPGFLYALVLGQDVPVEVQAVGPGGEVWIAIDGRDNKQPFEEFAWVDQGYDGNDGHARGWEGVVFVPQGHYTLTAHANAFDDGVSQTVEAPEVNLILKCYDLMAVDLSHFTAEKEAGGTARVGIVVKVRWGTVSEVNNRGFNLYRGRTRNGPWIKLNARLISSNVAPGSPVGADYVYVDNLPPMATGAVYYLLEDVDASGVKTRHGPVSP